MLTRCCGGTGEGRNGSLRFLIEAVAAVGPGAVIADDEVIATAGSDDPVMAPADQSVVMHVIAFNDNIVVIVVGFSPTPSRVFPPRDKQVTRLSGLAVGG